MRRAFLAAARLRHPDVGGDAAAFARLHESYERLAGAAPSVGAAAAPSRTSAAAAARPRTWAEVRAKRRPPALAPEAVEVSASSPEASAIQGVYRRTTDFNQAPAYLSVREGQGYYLFWSERFGDWKIGERLSDSGLCLAYAEGRRTGPPWMASLAQDSSVRGLRWEVWSHGSEGFAGCWLGFVPHGAA